MAVETEFQPVPTVLRRAAVGHLRERARLATAAVLGGGIPLSGFDPLNHVADVVGLEAAAWRLILMPAVALAALAVAAGAWFPRRPSPRLPRGVAAGGLLLLAGAAVSVLGSEDPRMTAVTMVLAVSAPAAVLLGVARAALPRGVLMASFLLATCALLLRADGVFLLEWGLPTTGDLFAAKYSNQPYDFHYYSLGNPDHTAGWLLIPLTVAVFWMSDRGLSRGQRLALGAAAVLVAATLLLTYARFALANAVAIGVFAVLAAPLARGAKVAALAAIGTAILTGVLTNLTYLAALFATESDATVPERLGSLGDGLAALAAQPFTGVGLGRFGPEGGYVTAHSSIVQAAAEMGVLGLSALLLLTCAVVAHARRVVRACGWVGLRPAMALAGAVYVIHAALAAPANEGLYSGYISVWGLTAALVIGGSVAPWKTTPERADRSTATVQRS